MASYNEIDGVPSHANRWLLRDVLRKEMGFKGFVVSDYYAIWELGYRPDTHGHFVAKNKKECCALAVNAGVNIELPDPDCYLYLVELVKKGVLKESQVDELVGPMLFWKFEMGLFDDPYDDPKQAERVVGSKPHRELALKAAHEAITLLKNDNNLAPLNLDNIKTIAVIGPNADRGLLGGYSGVPKHNVTVLEGIRKKVGKRAKVLYSEGCKITIGGSWNEDKVVPSDPEEDRRQIAETVKVAQKADVIILAIGGNEQTSREAWNLQHMGDRTSLDLIGRQNELVEAIAALGKPVIAFLFNGRPLSINHLIAHVPVIYECWYLGQETGHAIADVLFGDHNPGGKLPISFPRSTGHLPVFYNYKPSARRGYLFDDVSPLFAFGYLSLIHILPIGPRAQVVLEPVACLQVKMVGRLIQQQQVRLFQQQLRQRYAHLPAAGELLGSPRPVLLHKSQAGEHAAHLRIQRVHIVVSQPALYMRVAIRHRRVLRARRIEFGQGVGAVSYTHLDVYKRQEIDG